jgi:predicted permease
MLAKTPGFTAVAVATIALGIGASTAIFSVVNAVLLKPLPFPDPDRIVQLMTFSPAWAAGKNWNGVSIPAFIIHREQKQAFQEVAAYDSAARPMNLTGGEVPEQLRAVRVSANYFSLFGASVERGRTFSPDEDRPGGPRVVVISNGLWRRRFGGDPALVGKAIPLGGEPHVVIGVLGASSFPDPAAEVWVPLQADPNSTNMAAILRVAARLKPGVTLEMARAQMMVSTKQYKEKFPKWAAMWPKGERFTAEPLWEAVVGDVRHALLVLAGAVSFLFLIACANLTNLLLARATVRRREMAIRATLGATRRRLVGQLLIESVLLSMAGGIAGIPLGYLGARALIVINGGHIPRIDAQGGAVTLDARLLGFGVLMCLFCAMLFGLLPAFHASRPDPGTLVNEGGLRLGASLQQSKTRAGLVVAEIALALVLLTGAALLIRTFTALRTVNPGFDANHVLTMQMSLNDSRFGNAAAVAGLVRDAERRIESLPGVVALAATYSLPLENPFGGPFVIESHPNDQYGSGHAFVSRHYFDVFQIPLLRGRLFTDRDTGESAPVILVDAAMLRGFSGKYRWHSALSWHNDDPVGDRITIGKNFGPPIEDRTREVIGVVGDIRDAGLGLGPQPILYLPITQLTDQTSRIAKSGLPLTWAIRTRVEPTQLIGAIERELRQASGGLPVAHVRAMSQVVADSTARDRFNMVLLSIFAGVALLLAAVGVYGVMAYAVQHRTHEIGVRIALGARPRDVRRMVLFDGGRLALLGIVFGVLGALALTPLLRSLLYGVKPSDPGIFSIAVLLIAAVALLATYIPARWATRVDPAIALRWE